MILSYLKIFLGTSKLSPPAQGLVHRFISLASLQTSLYLISSTFYVLFVLEYVGFLTLGVLLAVSAALQAIFDYPSGVMGDWIGQRWILVISFISYGLSYGMLIHVKSFTDLLLVYVLAAFASSQESGALQSWFDNNYKVLINEINSDQKFYQEFLGKYQSIVAFFGANAIILGGFIATILFREIVFLLQSIGMFITAGLCFIFIDNFPEVPTVERSYRNYINLAKEGIKFVIFTKHMAFLVFSICLWNIIWETWVRMILFPIYFGYTGSDAGAGLLRFIGWIGNSILAAKAGIWSKKVNFQRWVPRLNFIIIVSFFGFFTLLITLYPLENSFNLIPIILLLSYFLIFLSLNNLFLILRQQLLFDFVPDSIRTSIYSLFTTMTLLIGAPFLVISGSIIEWYGFPVMLNLLMIIGIVSSGSMYLSIRSLSSEENGEKQD
ncbi:MAG: MFS transporter [Candidatus Hodarchaeota archaeon]